jgi:hypothetical protein
VAVVLSSFGVVSMPPLQGSLGAAASLPMELPPPPSGFVVPPSSLELPPVPVLPPLPLLPLAPVLPLDPVVDIVVPDPPEPALPLVVLPVVPPSGESAVFTVQAPAAKSNNAAQPLDKEVGIESSKMKGEYRLCTSYGTTNSTELFKRGVEKFYPNARSSGVL